MDNSSTTNLIPPSDEGGGRNERQPENDTQEWDTYVDNYTTRKSATSGALNMGLLCTTVDEIKTMHIATSEKWEMDIPRLVFLYISLVLQIVTMGVNLYLGSSGKMTKEKRKRQTWLNNTVMVLSFIITQVNILAAMFRGYTTEIQERQTSEDTNNFNSQNST
eukprot:TRINITY_DN2041_c0_g1_i14.p1 TRINITY_DN2041_c0_g1~~TRINITY_DN2041_c0_g1_i14.p1  ORF type:complete len:163 (+),score=31.43 TRINITY_DN2041_c0_g1_i14:49-537(+)